MTRVTTHPGEILREEFLAPRGLNASDLARQMRVPAKSIAAIVDCESGLTADIARRLSLHFGTTPGFWINLQAAHDRSVAQARTLW